MKSTELETEIKGYRKQDKLCFGIRETKELLTQGQLSKVYLAANCPDGTKSDLVHFGKLAQVPVETLQVPSDELGVICKRQHTILVLGLRK
ncbi:ribosomal L7Ae/L30e/S12e/Gadd45 family protein [Candidatus Woesearchaeota archaeon]|nr:ribosomal L7Ae/L30e/S12e/Gadd45 family protein [Candidatus Woesearchaeota archaeon]